MARDRAHRAADAGAAAPSLWRNEGPPITWRQKKEGVRGASRTGAPAPASPALEKGRNGKRTEEAEDQRKAGLAEQKGQSRAQARNGPRKAELERARHRACPPSFRAPASSSSGASCESTSCGASCASRSSAQRSSGAPWSCGRRASLSS